MKLYHGSDTSGITLLRPFLSNHGKPYVYFTDSEVLATVYAHSPVSRPNCFHTYRFREDGVLCYDEYFENQLEEIYAGQTGYVYECEGDFPKMERMPWIYLAQQEVTVCKCTEIPDIYSQLLQYENEGRLVIQRWHTVSERQRRIWRKVVRDSLQEMDISTPAGRDYADFVRAHFSIEP